MKSTFAMVLLLGIICTVVMAQKYPVKFDQVNIETVLSNDRVLSNYIKCLLDKGACTREGRELKSKCPVFFSLVRALLVPLLLHATDSIWFRESCASCFFHNRPLLRASDEKSLERMEPTYQKSMGIVYGRRAAQV